MANLTATSTWDNVLQLETTHQAIAGAGGTMNLQAQALANRTQFLADTKLNAADFKTQINASGTAPVYACRAWVNFNGTGTVAIRASGNVSSITDNAVGDYTINFTTAMLDANYCASTGAGDASLANSDTVRRILQNSRNYRFNVGNGATMVDTDFLSVSFFR